jgi:hypothetical protein
MRWDGHVAHTGAMKCACKICVGKGEGKQPLGRPNSGREDNINMNPKEGGRVWTGFMRLRIRINEGSCEHGNELWVT